MIRSSYSARLAIFLRPGLVVHGDIDLPLSSRIITQGLDSCAGGRSTPKSKKADSFRRSGKPPSVGFRCQHLDIVQEFPALIVLADFLNAGFVQNIRL